MKCCCICLFVVVAVAVAAAVAVVGVVVVVVVVVSSSRRVVLPYLSQCSQFTLPIIGHVAQAIVKEAAVDEFCSCPALLHNSANG